MGSGEGSAGNARNYYYTIVAMRKAVDASLNSNKILSLAGWSTGADCTSALAAIAVDGSSSSPASASKAYCANKISYWGGSAGRERQTLSGFFVDGTSLSPPAMQYIDILGIMSYDARYENYDPVTAYKDYWQLSLLRTDKAVPVLSQRPKAGQGLLWWWKMPMRHALVQGS